MAEKKEETVLKECDRIGRYRVRFIAASGKKGPMLDVREFVEEEGYTGFTRKGIRLDVAGVCALRTALDELETAGLIP